MQYLKNAGKTYDMQRDLPPDTFAPYYKEVSKPIPRSKAYTGYKEEKPIKEQMADDLKHLKTMAAELEDKHEQYPHHEQLFTQAADHAPDTNLL